jgi:hypothetical protein
MFVAGIYGTAEASMWKPPRSRVLLITGTHLSALDFNLLLENLSREHLSSGGGAGAHRPRHCEHDGDCDTAWASEDDLAPARDFINGQHGAGETWFCYVNPRLHRERCGRARSSTLVGPKAKAGRHLRRR